MSTLAEEQSARRLEAEAAEAQRAAMEEALRQARREVRRSVCVCGVYKEQCYNWSVHASTGAGTGVCGGPG